MDIMLPKQVLFLLHRLNEWGFEAFVVGGAVRDSLMRQTPNDWDLATNALPEQIKTCFAGYRLIEIGIRHGTIAVLMDHKSFEITTYRVDGTYLNNRHPNKVLFTACVQEDLARRDFSINAMAYHPDLGLLDVFGGREDLQRRQIFCIGDANTRFQEDALRMLRAMRFASILNFSVEEKTAEAIHRNKNLLNKISKERITTEFNRLLLGKAAEGILLEYVDVIAVFLPEIKVMLGGTWKHVVKMLAQASANLALRLTILLHDCKKSLDEQEITCGCEHLHPEEELVDRCLKRLKYDRKIIAMVGFLVAHYDIKVSPDKIHIKQQLAKFGEHNFCLLLELNRADSKMQIPVIQKKCLQSLHVVEHMLNEIIEKGDCFSLKTLAVSGDDLLAIGVPKNQKLGTVLQNLLELVINEKLPNEKVVLLQTAKKLFVQNSE